MPNRICLRFLLRFPVSLCSPYPDVPVIGLSLTKILPSLSDLTNSLGPDFRTVRCCVLSKTLLLTLTVKALWIERCFWTRSVEERSLAPFLRSFYRVVSHYELSSESFKFSLR